MIEPPLNPWKGMSSGSILHLLKSIHTLFPISVKTTCRTEGKKRRPYLVSNISLHISSCFRHTSGPMLSSSHFSSSYSNMDDNNSHLLSLVVVEAVASSHWKPHFQQMGVPPLSCCSCFALFTVCRSISPQT